jgi:two-component sensor histidine kinase
VKLRESEKRLRVLVGELQHRTRNLISVVGAMADKTLRTSKTFDDFKASFQDRLGTLGCVQGLLFRMKEGDRLNFDELIETELSAQSGGVGEDGPVTLDGPKGVRLRSSTVQTLAMVLHELVTNAVKIRRTQAAPPAADKLGFRSRDTERYCRTLQLNGNRRGWFRGARVRFPTNGAVS